MEDKAILRAEYHKKIYSESEKNNFVREAVAQTREDFFSFFRESVEGLITERLLNFCTSHPAITSMDIQNYPIAASEIKRDKLALNEDGAGDKLGQQSIDPQKIPVGIVPLRFFSY